MTNVVGVSNVTRRGIGSHSALLSAGRRGQVGVRDRGEPMVDIHSLPPASTRRRSPRRSLRTLGAEAARRRCPCRGRSRRPTPRARSSAAAGPAAARSACGCHGGARHQTLGGGVGRRSPSRSRSVRRNRSRCCPGIAGQVDRQRSHRARPAGRSASTWTAGAPASRRTPAPTRRRSRVTPLAKYSPSTSVVTVPSGSRRNRLPLPARLQDRPQKVLEGERTRRLGEIDCAVGMFRSRSSRTADGRPSTDSDQRRQRAAGAVHREQAAVAVADQQPAVARHMHAQRRPPVSATTVGRAAVGRDAHDAAVDQPVQS